MSTGRTDYTLPTTKLEHTPTRLQVKPHDGFTPEAITLRAPFTLASETDLPDPMLGTPAGWTTRALCLDDWELFDDPQGDDVALAQRVCGMCPVKDTCLAVALEDEVWDNGGPLPFDHRSGVRGGLTTRERTTLTAPPVPTECIHGHPMSADKDYLNLYRVRWECNTCRTARRQGRRAA